MFFPCFNAKYKMIYKQVCLVNIYFLIIDETAITKNRWNHAIKLQKEVRF